MFDATPSPGRARAARSRDALISAAQAMMERGEPVTLARAAAEAGVGRATAYRHFARPEALALAACPDPEAAPIPDILSGLTDPVERVMAVHDHFTRLAQRDAARTRARLRRGLLPDAPSRPGARRRAAFRAALAPVRHRMEAPAVADLVDALCLLTEAEAHIALTQTGGAAEARARSALRRAVRLEVEGR